MSLAGYVVANRTVQDLQWAVLSVNQVVLHVQLCFIIESSSQQLLRCMLFRSTGSLGNSAALYSSIASDAASKHYYCSNMYAGSSSWTQEEGVTQHGVSQSPVWLCARWQKLASACGVC